MDSIKRQLFLVFIQLVLVCCFAVPSVFADVRVFVTSETYNGDLDGAAGADAKCQACADAAELGGTWKAWICDSTTTASDRLIHSDENYIRASDSTIIAEGWTDLTNGSLGNAIVKDENGDTPSVVGVYTGCNSSGASISDKHCSNWADSSTSYTGEYLKCCVKNPSRVERACVDGRFEGSGPLRAIKD